MNNPPLVIQYGILDHKWGASLCKKIPNKSYTPAFKRAVFTYLSAICTFYGEIEMSLCFLVWSEMSGLTHFVEGYVENMVFFL